MLTLHVAVVVFVVGGLLPVLVGNLCNWQWVNIYYLRLAHLIAIAFVAVEASLGATCPLTSLEMWLRGSTQATRGTRPKFRTLETQKEGPC